MTVKLNTLEIKTRLPALPPTMPVFALAAPTLDERRTAIGRLGEHFKLGPTRPVELDHGVSHASERGDITYFHASGAVLARDATVGLNATDELRKWEGLVQTGVDGQRVALGPDAGKRLLAQARGLVQPLGLLGKEVATEAIQLDQVCQLDAKGKEITHGGGQASIKFNYAMSGVAVRGAGAKTVLFAEPDAPGQARFAGLFHAWRNPGTATTLKLPGLEEVLGVGLLTDPELDAFSAAGHKIQITRLDLVYMALPAFVRQAHLFPMIQVEGVVSEGTLGISFHFARFHHVLPPRSYQAANLYGAYLMGNPDGIRPRDGNQALA